MGLETGTTIAQLDATWPVGASDPKSQGDDHLRLLKSVLKTQFPGSGGLGFNVPIVAKESDLNALPALVSAQSAFIVNKTLDQTLSGSSQSTLIWQNVAYDNRGGFTANKYTIPIGQAGLWLFYCSALCSSASASLEIKLLVNDFILTTGTAFEGAPILPKPEALLFKQMNVGDTISCAIQKLSGPTSESIFANPNTAFFGFRVI